MKACPFLFALFCVLAASAVRAQTGFEANIVSGKVLKHTSKFNAPIPASSNAVELAWIKQTTGTKEWERRRNYPLWGLGLKYTDYGDGNVLGAAVGFYPFLQIPLIRGKALEWTFRGGLGIGYATSIYRRAPDWDTVNNAIGSHINNFSSFATDLRYRLNDHWSLQLGVAFSHMSNGVMKLPNLGINMYGAQIGLRYRPQGDRAPRIDGELPKLRNRFLLQVRGGIATTEAGKTDGPGYPIYLGTVYGSRRYASKNKLLLGVDYSYYTSLYAFQRNNEINVGAERANSWRAGLFVGHEWLFGRMAFIAQAGYYLKQSVNGLDKTYQKLGYSYYVVQRENGPLKELALSVLLKTHIATAELIEYGLTMGF
jgi:hypothetical protein